MCTQCGSIPSEQYEELRDIKDKLLFALEELFWASGGEESKPAAPQHAIKAAHGGARAAIKLARGGLTNE